jgi:tRNA threonylcarbamoyladenosine biosynthesis protein TsaB
MELRGWSLRELKAVIVVHGPGSFTGVRVGLSAAKGLSEAGGIPLIAISRLALLAAVVGEGDETVHVVLDAGRGEFYYGEYVGHRCLRESLLSQEEVSVAVAGGSIVVCETKVAEMLSELHPRVVGEPLAGNVLSLALERIAANEFDDVSLLDANYLRRTDAEIFAKPKAKSAVR